MPTNGAFYYDAGTLYRVVVTFSSGMKDVFGPYDEKTARAQRTVHKRSGRDVKMQYANVEWKDVEND